MFKYVRVWFIISVKETQNDADSSRLHLNDEFTYSPNKLHLIPLNRNTDISFPELCHYHILYFM